MAADQRADRWLALLLALPAAACVLMFVMLPILCMALFSFWSIAPDGSIDRTLTLASWHQLFADGFYWSIIGRTLVFAAGSTFATALVAYPCAIFLMMQPPARRATLLLLLLIPSWISYVVRTMAWLPMLGRNGPVNLLLIQAGLIAEPLDLLYGDGAVTLGMVQYLLPIVLLNIYLGLATIDPSLVAAARSLGASPWRAFSGVTFPLALPALSGACVLAFILSMGAYITPLLLGGKDATYVSRLVYDEIVGQQNWPLGAALATIIILLLTAMVALYGRFAGLGHLVRGRG